MKWGCTLFIAIEGQHMHTERRSRYTHYQKTYARVSAIATTRHYLYSMQILFLINRKQCKRWIKASREGIYILYSYIYKFSLLLLPILSRWSIFVLEFSHVPGLIISLHIGQCRPVVSHGIFMFLQLWSQMESNWIKHGTHHSVGDNLMVVCFE